MIAKTEEVCALLPPILPCGLWVGADGTNQRDEEGDHLPLYANEVRRMLISIWNALIHRKSKCILF